MNSLILYRSAHSCFLSYTQTLQIARARLLVWLGLPSVVIGFVSARSVAVVFCSGLWPWVGLLALYAEPI